MQHRAEPDQRQSWVLPVVPHRPCVDTSYGTLGDTPACRPDLLIVGNITVDLVDGTTPTVRPGMLPAGPWRAVPCFWGLYPASEVQTTCCCPSQQQELQPAICLYARVCLQGGAVSYASVVAQALKASHCVVTGQHSRQQGQGALRRLQGTPARHTVKHALAHSSHLV